MKHRDYLYHFKKPTGHVVCCLVKRGVDGVIGVSSPNEEPYRVTTMAPTLFARSTDIVYWTQSVTTQCEIL